METQRGVLDVFARNIAAAQVADANGFVRFEPVLGQDSEGAAALTGLRARRVKNDGIVGEMLAIMQAQRAYESDATLFTLGKHLAEQTIAVDRA